MSDEGRILVDVAVGPGTVAVTLDGGEVLEVAPEALPAGMPPAGQRLAPSLVAALRDAAARKLIARRLLQLLDRRLLTVARLHEKLVAEGYPPAAVAAVLSDMQARGIHDDRRFAEAWCRDTLRARPVGRHYLEARLRDQGIDATLATEVVAIQLPAQRERQLAAEAAAKRWRRESSRDWRAASRVARFLASRGFPAAVAADAVRSQRPAEPETEDEAT